MKAKISRILILFIIITLSMLIGCNKENPEEKASHVIEKTEGTSITDEEIIEKLKSKSIYYSICVNEYNTSRNLVVDGKTKQAENASRLGENKTIDVGDKKLKEIESIKISNKNFDKESNKLTFDAEITSIINTGKFIGKYSGVAIFSDENWDIYILPVDQHTEMKLTNTIKNMGITLNESSINTMDLKYSFEFNNDFKEAVIKVEGAEINGAYKVTINNSNNPTNIKNSLYFSVDEDIDNSDNLEKYNILLYLDDEFKIQGILYDNNKNIVGYINNDYQDIQ